MATCPHCKGHLTDSHRCPRRPAVMVAEIAGSAVAGAIVALLLAAILEPHGDFDMLSMLAGALIAVAVDRFLRR